MDERPHSFRKDSDPRQGLIIDPVRLNRGHEGEAFVGGRLSRGTRRRSAGHGHGGWGGNRMLVGWSLALGVLTLLVIGGFMMFWLRGQGGRKPRPAVAAAAAMVQAATRFEAPDPDRALAMVKEALAIGDPQEVASWFHVGGAEAAEVVGFIAQTAARDGEVKRYHWLSSMDVENQQMEGVLVVYGSKVRPVERLAILTPDPAGEWKVDFDAFARSSRPSWEELLDGRAQRAEVRVFIGRDQYYNGPFADDSKWVCYGMVSLEAQALLPDGKELLYGYCRTASPQAKAMGEIFAAGARTRRVTLEVLRVGAVELRQFEITRVLAADWVRGASDFDEKFQGAASHE